LAGNSTPQQLSFPDATGKSGVGNYVLYGDAAWTLTDRIVSVTRTRTSPNKAITASGYGQTSASGDQAYNPGSGYLTVANYPTNISFTHGMSSIGSSKDGGWNLPNSSHPFMLGKWTNGTNNYVEVTIFNFPNTFTLVENPPGDFNSSGAVDAADYVTWRQAPGNLAPFLTSYNVWRNNFGNPTSGASLSSVPEPTAITFVVLMGLVVAGRRHRK
jgi:hypothetical protein